jgi:hypothetical protein
MWWYCLELMYMPSPMWKEKSSSGRGGGGDIGIIVGIVQDTMTVDGIIIVVIRNGIEGYLMTGGITIETIGGMAGLGIIVPFLMVTWIGIGEVSIGEMTMDGTIPASIGVVIGAMTVLVIDTEDIKTFDKIR